MTGSNPLKIMKYFYYIKIYDWILKKSIVCRYNYNKRKKIDTSETYLFQLKIK